MYIGILSISPMMMMIIIDDTVPYPPPQKKSFNVLPIVLLIGTMCVYHQ